MAFLKKRVATFYDKEILLSATGLEAIRSVVIDSTEVAVNATSGRYVLEAGTVLVKQGANKVKPAGSGISAGNVIGILANTVEFFYPTEAEITDEPAAAFFHGCQFDTAQLIGYTGNEAAIKSALPTCRFDTKDF